VEGKGQPTWQPISALGLVASLIDAQLEDGRDQHQLLLKARPYVLDDATVERLLRVYGETVEDLWLYDEQLARWRRSALSPAQRNEVERLQSQMTALREVVERILALGARLKDQTIETLLAKSDLEIGIEGLLGGRDG
jgi:hypothetical protein